MRLPGGLRQRATDERGAVIAIVALSMGVLLVATAFSIDLGRQMLRRRDMQAIADVVSMDLARMLDGNTPAYFNSGAGTGAFQTEKADSAARNNASTIKSLIAVAGQYDQTTGWQIDNAKPATAVKVTASDDVSYQFVPGGNSVTRSAIANRPRSATGAFKVGSFLASLNPTSNTLFGSILGAVIPGANLLAYNGLANTQVRVDLIGLYLAGGVVTPDQMANVQVTQRQLIDASILALQNQCGCSSNSQITVLQSLRAITSTTGPTFNLGDALGLNLDGGDPAGFLTVDMLQVLATSAFLADGDHAISIPTFNLGIPQIGNVTLSLTAIEGPQIGGVNDLASATTSQFRLQVTPHITVSTANVTQNLCTLPLAQLQYLNTLLGGLLSTVTCLLGGTLNELVSLGIDASPTLNVTAAQVTATQHLDCVNKQLTLSTSPVAFSLDAPMHLDVTATVAGTNIGKLLNVDLAAHASTPGSAANSTFTATDAGPHYIVFNPTTSQVGSVPLGLRNLLSISATNVSVGNVNLTNLANSLSGLVTPLVNNALGLLDQYLVTPLAQMLGLNLGGAQLWPLWLDCTEGGPELVE